MYKLGQTLIWCGNRTFRTGFGSSKRYYEIRNCEACGEIFLADKYGKVEYCSDKCKGPAKGRPIGTRLKQISKDIIAHGRTGLHHTESTKQKISNQVKIGMENSILNPLSGKNHPLYKHGKSLTPLWFKWGTIKSRCNNPNNKNYKYYGDKSIKMCKEWLEFIPFRDWCLNNGYKPGLHIHREDPLGDYGPDNCVFLTPSEHSLLHSKLRRLSKIDK